MLFSYVSCEAQVPAAQITAHPDLTLAQLQDWLEAEHGVRLSDGAILAVLDTYTPQECANQFNAAGYEP